MNARWAVGLMTGTVLDGNIDVALLRTDGQSVETVGPFALIPYDPGMLALLRQCLIAANDWQFQGPEPDVFVQAERELTLQQTAAVRRVVRRAGLSLDDIAVVGFHGQTVLHRPPTAGQPGRTRQLGDGALMARRLGVPVAYDFRSADMLAGGQGAPLSAIYHTALLKALGRRGETAVLNLGGVANLSWYDGIDLATLVAFDTGPANAPLNDFLRARGLGEMDRDGALALCGQVDEARLDELLSDPWLSAPWPKSLDRNRFNADMAEGCSDADGAALLTAFSAAAVGRALALLPHRPLELIVCGGGRHNPALMSALERRARVTVTPAERVRWRGDAIEAECFAYLAMRVLHRLPISFPGTTGVAQAMQGGCLTLP